MLLIRNVGTKRLVTRIVETEAYCSNDPACHAWSLERKNLDEPELSKARSAVLFGDPGTIYVYLNYGVHWLFNIVTEQKGTPGAVLIRAVEPIDGVEIMRVQRPVKNIHDLCNGPGKLTQALRIDEKINGLKLGKNTVLVAQEEYTKAQDIGVSERIGISKGQDKLWRFFCRRSQSVSKLRKRTSLKYRLK